MKNLFIVSAFLVSPILLAQNPGSIQTVPISPAGQVCQPNQVSMLTPNGTVYTCQGGVMAAIGGSIGPAGAGYAATGTGSVSVGTGAFSLTTQTNLAYLPGMRVRVAAASSPTNYMEGAVLTYSGTTISVNSDTFAGTGTFSSWNIGIAGIPGAGAALPAVTNLISGNGSGGGSDSGVAASSVATLTGTQTLTNKTLNGVAPSVFAFLDPTSSIQTQLNGKQASLGYTAQNAATANSNNAGIGNCSAGQFTTGTAAGSTQPCAAAPQKFFVTAPPTSIAGNLPGDFATDTTHHLQYVCGAPSGTAAPACTSVSAGGWMLAGGGTGNASGYTAVTFSATPVFACNSNTINYFVITLTGNVTSSTLTGCTSGQNITFQISQDATGGRTFVWPTNMTGAGTIDGTASGYSAQSFQYDGTNANSSGPMYVVGAPPGVVIPGSTSGSATLSAPSTGTYAEALPPVSATLAAAGVDIGGSTDQNVIGINGVPLCTGFTPTNGQVLQYTTGSSPNPCYTSGAGGGGGGGVAGNSGYTASVSASTSTTVNASTHLQGLHPFVQCLSSASPAVAVACYFTIDSSGNVVFTWATAFTGSINILGGVAPSYSTTVSAVTSQTINATTHLMGLNPIAVCFDNSTPRRANACNYTVDTSGNVVFAWASAFTGKIVIK